MTSTREINENYIKKLLKKILSLINYKFVKINNFHDKYNDFILEASDEEKKDLDSAIKLALCSRASLWSIMQSLKYISDNSIKGDMVECGVFTGGALALISKYQRLYSINSKIYGFDTFEEGFDNATLTEKDVTIGGKKVALYGHNDRVKSNFYPSLEMVRKNIENFSGNNEPDLKLIKGDVLKTLKDENNLPKKISFLRLDTDLYTLTKFQLEILFPRLVKGGILLIDDYGMFPGVKNAVDEYFEGKKIWLHRVDFTARLLIKD
jgi:O-methyltransferase